MVYISMGISKILEIVKVFTIVLLHLILHERNLVLSLERDERRSFSKQKSSRWSSLVSISHVIIFFFFFLFLMHDRIVSEQDARVTLWVFGICEDWVEIRTFYHCLGHLLELWGRCRHLLVLFFVLLVHFIIGRCFFIGGHFL